MGKMTRYEGLKAMSIEEVAAEINNLFSKDKADSNGYIKGSSLCKVTISIEPYDEILTVNGKAEKSPTLLKKQSTWTKR